MVGYCVDCGTTTKGGVRCKSCAIRKSWSDPKTKKRHSDAMKRAWADPEHSKNHVFRTIWKDPEEKKKIVAGLKRAWTDPDVRKDRVAMYKKAWADPGCRARHEEASADPEYRQRLSESRKKLWQDPDYRQKMSEAMKKVWQDPDYKKLQSDILRRRWADGCYDGVDFGNHGESSKIELEVLESFKEFGIEAVSQYRPEGCSFTYDIYLPEFQTLVEVDGEFWHHSEWAKERGAPEQDERKDNWALSNGFDIVRLPESVLNNEGIGSVVYGVMEIVV